MARMPPTRALIRRVFALSPMSDPASIIDFQSVLKEVLEQQSTGRSRGRRLGENPGWRTPRAWSHRDHRAPALYCSIVLHKNGPPVFRGLALPLRSPLEPYITSGCPSANVRRG